jgi:hypothetical protein
MAKGSRSGKLAPGEPPAPGAVPETFRAARPLPEAPVDETLALESAQYIAQMSAELASIARASSLDLLAYFLEMARVEASNSVRKFEDRAAD